MTRKLLILGAALVFLFSLVSVAAAGRIVATSDADGNSCLIDDTYPNVVLVHIIASDDAGMTAVQFAAPKPECWTGATWLADQMYNNATIGTTQNIDGGISVALLECLTGSIYIGYMVFSAAGDAETCCPYPIVKADSYEEFDGPVMVDCHDTLREVETIGAVINSDGSCDVCASPTPVEHTTWGRVKSLYE